MPRASADPLRGTSHLLVDGTNLLHALGRGRGPLPAVALTGRLRALVPPGVTVVVVLDGAPAPGAAGRRVTSGVEVRHAGRRSADAVLRELAAASPDGTLVVTDDLALGASIRATGARTVRAGWLAERLAGQRLGAPAVGRPMPPPATMSLDGAPGADRDEGPRWKPGRGATRKTGNPKRGRRSA
ncbi:MAG: hypothetical protein M0T75_08255 [Chloroflexi bacterium]|nr:hypothetical protein [Chloroflexota bacterium]